MEDRPLMLSLPSERVGCDPFGRQREEDAALGLAVEFDMVALRQDPPGRREDVLDDTDALEDDAVERGLRLLLLPSPFVAVLGDTDSSGSKPPYARVRIFSANLPEKRGGSE
jgi:hypothetical protein